MLNTSKPGIKLGIATFCTIALLLWLAQHDDLARFIEYSFTTWAGISTVSITSIVSLILLSHGLRAWRLRCLYEHHYARSFISIFTVSSLHTCLNFLLPMRLGELALPALSRLSLNIPIHFSSTSLLLLRLLDVHCLCLLLVIWASFLFIKGYMLIVLVGMLLIGPFACTTMLKKIIKNVQSIHHITVWLESPWLLVKLYVITVLTWTIKLGALTYLTILFFTEKQLALSWYDAYPAVMLADASVLSPIAGIANAGTFEAAFVMPLSLRGYDISAMLPLAVNVHMFILFTNVAIGCIGWLLLSMKKL